MFGLLCQIVRPRLPARATNHGVLTGVIATLRRASDNGGNVFVTYGSTHWSDGTPDIDFWMADDAERAPVIIRFEDDGRALRFERTG